MIELSKRAVSKHTGLPEKDLNALKRDYPIAYESIMLGNTQLQAGYMAGEVIFKMRQKFNPDIKAYEEENKMLWKRVKELESVINVPVEAL